MSGRLRGFASSAVTTRLSPASLPALVRGGLRHLDLPDSATGLVLPLSVAVSELNLPVSGVVELWRRS